MTAARQCPYTRQAYWAYWGGDRLGTPLPERVPER